MAGLLQDQGKLSEAEPLLLEALKAYKRTLGAEHPQTPLSINNMATLLLDQGQLSEAEPLLLEALEACRRTLGAEHPHTLTSITVWRSTEAVRVWSMHVLCRRFFC